MSQLITGNTYPHREALRALGGTWSKRLTGWLVPDEKAGEARALVASAVSPRAYASRSRVVVSRFSSGATVTQNSRGRCEDAPCCGCCS